MKIAEQRRTALPDEQAQTKEPRPFGEWLTEQRNGACAVELATTLKECVDAVLTYGKAGTVTLTLKIKPISRGAADGVTVVDSVTSKIPEAENGESFFFVNRDGDLVRATPAQQGSIYDLMEPDNRVDVTNLKEIE